MRRSMVSINQQFAQQALRVVALAQRVLDPDPATFESKGIEQQLVFLGLAAMKDPLRPEANKRLSDAGPQASRP